MLQMKDELTATQKKLAAAEEATKAARTVQSGLQSDLNTKAQQLQAAQVQAQAQGAQIAELRKQIDSLMQQKSQVAGAKAGPTTAPVNGTAPTTAPAPVPTAAPTTAPTTRPAGQR
jgi:uncharacterized protein YigA (DUF484 family)